MSEDAKDHEESFEVFVNLIKGEKIKRLDLLSESDPFVVFTLGKDKHTSTTKEDSLNPLWNEGFQFFLSGGTKIDDSTLNVECFDKDPIGADWIGSTRISLLEVWKKKSHRLLGWFKLLDLDNKPSGRLFLEIKIIPLTSAPDTPLLDKDRDSDNEKDSEDYDNDVIVEKDFEREKDKEKPKETKLKIEIDSSSVKIKGKGEREKSVIKEEREKSVLREEKKVSDEQIFVWQTVEGIKLAAREAADAQKQDKPRVEEAIFNIAPPSNYTSDSAGILTIVDYFPSIFLNIKNNLTTTEDYIKSWTFARAEDIPQPHTGAGRSGSLFMLSADQRFIFKSIPQHEVETIRCVLSAYADHIGRYPTSRLMRILALHCFHNPKYNNSFFLLVANNILYLPLGRSMMEKYDLKGRAPKHRPKAPSKGSVWKDNQLSRTFHLDKETRDALLTELIRDANFLDSQNMMDYSLLIGVSKTIYEEEKAPKEPLELSIDPEETKRNVVGIPPGHGQPLNIQVVSALGHPSSFNIGIVDFLSRYGIKKKTAHFFKSLIFPVNTLSTVPAQYYAKRFIDYLPTIFILCTCAPGQPDEPDPSPEAVAAAVAAESGVHAQNSPSTNSTNSTFFNPSPTNRHFIPTSTSSSTSSTSSSTSSTSSTTSSTSSTIIGTSTTSTISSSTSSSSSSISASLFAGTRASAITTSVATGSGSPTSPKSVTSDPGSLPEKREETMRHASSSDTTEHGLNAPVVSKPSSNKSLMPRRSSSALFLSFMRTSSTGKVHR